ncbi:MAG: xylulokinase [Candidatus Dormibacteraeota bacterium]|nr:xylulokinase [Candidatus Dormibacteraeota bacterium]
MFLGLDLGTSSAKALLIDVDGSVAGAGSSAYAVHHRQPGWAESDPQDWWDAATIAVQEAVGSRGIDVAAVGLAGQMHGVVLCEEDGEPLRPAILWADARAHRELEPYRALGPGLKRQLANPITTGMAGPTLLWVRDHETTLYRQTRWALQPKDWLRLRLTGEVATDPSDASATLLYDLSTDYWAKDVLDALDLRLDFLAPIRESSEICGLVSRSAAPSWGIRPNVPVVGGAADTAAAALSSGVLEPGAAQVSVGTGAQIVAPRDRVAIDPTARTHLYRAAAPERWYAMAAIQNAGLALDWVLATLGATWDDLYREAFSVPPGSDGLIFLPYISGERTPHFDPSARGAWVGLQLRHGRGHLLRASLEGVAFALRQALDALVATGISATELRLAGRGSTEPRWRQMLADILDRALHASRTSAASAKGAALLAGIGFGAWSGVDQVATLADPVELVATPQAIDAYRDAYQRYRELYLPIAAALS